jgi:hypothetical protein
MMGGHALACTCGGYSCGCGTLPRHFITPAEEKEMLEKYKESLKNELAGLEERLKELNARLNRIA